MDAKEAIEYLKSMLFPSDMSESTLKAIAVNRMAISALEKVPVLEAENARLEERETPKTLKMNGDWLSCPNCGCNFAGSIPNYCRECGQRFKNFKR